MDFLMPTNYKCCCSEAKVYIFISVAINKLFFGDYLTEFIRLSILIFLQVP